MAKSSSFQPDFQKSGNSVFNDVTIRGTLKIGAAKKLVLVNENGKDVALKCNSDGAIVSNFAGDLSGNVTGNLTGNATSSTIASGLTTTSSINTSGIITATTFSGNITDRTEFAPGEVIETISSSCDGSTVVVRSGSYVMANVTAAQNGTNTFTTITGSSISYTPPAGTKKVHYRFWYHFDVTENSGISNHILQIDGTEVYPSANTIASNYASTNWHHACFPVSVEYTINCDADSDDANNGKFTSWTSPKTLRVQYREHSGSYESRLHRNTWWAGSSASANYQIMKPHLTIQAIA